MLPRSRGCGHEDVRFGGGSRPPRLGAGGHEPLLQDASVPGIESLPGTRVDECIDSPLRQSYDQGSLGHRGEGYRAHAQAVRALTACAPTTRRASAAGTRGSNRSSVARHRVHTRGSCSARDGADRALRSARGPGGGRRGVRRGPRTSGPVMTSSPRADASGDLSTMVPRTRSIHEVPHAHARNQVGAAPVRRLALFQEPAHDHATRA